MEVNSSNLSITLESALILYHIYVDVNETVDRLMQMRKHLKILNKKVLICIKNEIDTLLSKLKTITQN